MEKRHIFLVGRISFFILIFGLWGLALILLPQNAFAQQKPLIIKHAHPVPEAQSVAKQARVFEKCVKVKSDGNVIIEVYPAAQLFGHRDLFPAVRKGAVEMGTVGSPYMQGSIPFMEIFDVPFLFKTLDQVRSSWYGYPGEILNQEFEKNGVRLMSPGYFGFTEVSNSNREIRTLKDFRGLKLRAPGPMLAEIVNAMGGAPVTIGGEEVYLAMARKVVDGSLTGLNSMVSRKYWEVQKYVTLLHLSYIDIPMIINLQFWRSLPRDVQALLEQCAKESEEFIWKETIKEERDCAGILAEKGMKVYTPTPAEMEEFSKVSLPIKEKWIKKHGDVAEKMVKFVENLK